MYNEIQWCQEKKLVSAPCLVDDLCSLDVGVVLEALFDDVLVQDVRKKSRFEDVGLGRDGQAVVPRSVHYLMLDQSQTTRSHSRANLRELLIRIPLAISKNHALDDIST